jgi:hypothetical protein
MKITKVPYGARCAVTGFQTWCYNENPDENTMIDHIMGSQSGVNTREIMSYKFMMRK